MAVSGENEGREIDIWKQPACLVSLARGVPLSFREDLSPLFMGELLQGIFKLYKFKIKILLWKEFVKEGAELFLHYEIDVILFS